MDNCVSKVCCSSDVQEEVPIQDIGIRLDEGLLANDGSNESEGDPIREHPGFNGRSDTYPRIEARNNMVSTSPPTTNAARSPVVMPAGAAGDQSVCDSDSSSSVYSQETWNQRTMESSPATNMPIADIAMTPNRTGRQQQKVLPPSIHSR